MFWWDFLYCNTNYILINHITTSSNILITKDYSNPLGIDNTEFFSNEDIDTAGDISFLQADNGSRHTSIDIIDRNIN